MQEGVRVQERNAIGREQEVVQGSAYRPQELAVHLRHQVVAQVQGPHLGEGSNDCNYGVQVNERYRGKMI